MLSDLQVKELLSYGFTVVPGPLTQLQHAKAAAAYDRVTASASTDDIHVGSTTTRVNDLVNRGPEFDGLYSFDVLIDAGHKVIGQPFHLSTLHARTVRPRTKAQELHVDFPRTDDGWPMLGFIYMVDEFGPDNGATGFLAGSHLWDQADPHRLDDRIAARENELVACGAAGSVILFNGSVWHGHLANSTDKPRRSLQGAFIRRTEASAMDWASRMTRETLARIGPRERDLLGI